MKYLLSWRMAQCEGQVINEVPYTPVRPIYIHQVTLRISAAVADTNPLYLIFNSTALNVNRPTRDFIGLTVAQDRMAISTAGQISGAANTLFTVPINRAVNSFVLIPNGAQKFDVTVYYNFIDELPDYYVPGANAWD
jgi:hypothetical protein